MTSGTEVAGLPVIPPIVPAEQKRAWRRQREAAKGDGAEALQVVIERQHAEYLTLQRQHNAEHGEAIRQRSEMSRVAAQLAKRDAFEAAAQARIEQAIQQRRRQHAEAVAQLERDRQARAYRAERKLAALRLHEGIRAALGLPVAYVSQ